MSKSFAKDTNKPRSPFDWFKVLQAVVLALTAVSLFIGLLEFELIAVWIANTAGANS